MIDPNRYYIFGNKYMYQINKGAGSIDVAVSLTAALLEDATTGIRDTRIRNRRMCVSGCIARQTSFK